MAAAHADLPMAARTYGQAATPTSFGAVVASWGHPVLRHRARLAAVLQQASPATLVKYQPLPEETHATIYHPAALQALRTLFPAPPPASP